MTVIRPGEELAVLVGPVVAGEEAGRARAVLAQLEAEGFRVVPLPPDVARRAAGAAGPVTDSAFEAVIDAVTVPAVPPPTWFDQARRNARARQELLDEFGALRSEDVAALAGSSAANRRATAHRWQAEQQIFSVTHHGRTLYPAFQFDPDSGRPRPAVAQILAVLPAGMDGWARALWWTTPSDAAGWARPVDLLDEDPLLAMSAAQGTAADWATAASA